MFAVRAKPATRLLGNVLGAVAQGVFLVWVLTEVESPWRSPLSGS